MRQQVPVYVTNPDFVFAGEYPVPRFAAGAFAVCLSTLFHKLTGQNLDITYMGKPTGITFNYARQLLQRQRAAQTAREPSSGRGPGAGQAWQDVHFDSLFMVGDNPAADIRGANAAGAPWQSVLVRTGVFQGTENDPHDQAKHVVADVGEAVELVLAHAAQ